MNETTKTSQYLVAAVVSVLLATFASWSSAPSKLSGFEDIGKVFFEDFTDPGAASSLRVVTYNESTASARPFTVEKKEGVWRIPSHHNYPADGKDRLAKIAASLIGVKRGAVASLVTADHERFGVVDPLDEKAETLKGRGQRVTLFKEGGGEVADLIIGKEVEGQSGTFYCRKAGEAQTYKTQLKVDISTKFADWVEADLLKLERDNITRLDSVHTKVSEQGQLVENTLKLTRDKFSDPWKLDGIDDDTEEVNKGDIDAMVTVLDNLKLVGIRERPKMEGKSILGNDLSLRLPKGATRNRQVVNAIVGQLRDSLEEKGFQVFHNEQTDEAQLYSSAGELIAATNDGVRYHLSFGNVFSGSDDEIEKGISTTKKDGKDEKEDKEQKASDPPSDEKKDDKKDSGKKSRYLFVRASFLDSLLGPKPVEPTKPEVPEGVQVDENGNVVEPKEAKKDDEKKPEEKKDGDAAKDGEKKDEPKKDPAEEYKKALADFKKAKDKYASDVKAFDKKVEDGNKKVKELNDRFGDWYYVISAEDFDKLRLNRDQMVKAKEKKEEKKDEGEAKKDDDKKPETAKPADAPTDKPADAKPESKDGDKKADDKKPEDKPATEKPAADKPVDDKKAEEKKPEEKPAEEKKPAADKPADGEKPKAEDAK